MSNSLINTLQDFLSKQDIKVEQELLSASLRELNFSQTLELMKKIKEFDVEGVTSMVNVDYDSPVQNEWVQDSPAQGFSGQERNFIEELCLRMDGVSKSPEGLKWMGKSETWDEGNVLSDKGKLTTVMLWARKNKDDLYSRMGSDFKVYSDGNDKGQSDGNQIMQNIINKVGKIGEPVATESKTVNEVVPAFLAAPWVIPALATAVRVGGPALIRLLKVSKNAAGKVINSDKVSNAATSIIKHPGTSLSWIGGGYVFKSVYDVMEKTKEVIGDFLDDLSIEAFAKIVWKHKLPVAAVMAVLYGGKQLKDYMSGEEEEKGNTTINNYYNKSDDKPVEESYSDDFVYNSDEVKEWITKAENDLGRKITNEEKAELNEFWPAIAAAATRIPPNTYATAATAVGAAASKAGKWIRKKLRNSVDHNLKEDYANEQHEQLEYIHHVLQECGDGNMDITMVEQAIEYVEDIREQHFDDEGDTKSESVNEHEMSLLGKVARQMEADAHSGDYTAIEELLHNVTEDEMEAFLSDHRSDDFDEGVMGTIGQGIDNAVVGAGKLIKKGAKAAAPHVKKAAKDGVKKISKLGSKNTTTSFDGKGGSSTSVAYNEDDMKDVTPAGYGPDDYDEKDVPPEAHGGDMKKMQDLYRHNEDRNNHSGNIEMLAQAFGNRDEVKAIEGLMKIIKRQGHVTSEQSEMMYNAIHKKYYSQLFPAENEGNAFSGELAKAKIDGKKEFDVDGKTYKVKEALSRLIDKQKMK